MSIDDYISSQPEEKQPVLLSARQTIAAMLPDAEERISYGKKPLQ